MEDPRDDRELKQSFRAKDGEAGAGGEVTLSLVKFPGASTSHCLEIKKNCMGYVCQNGSHE